jgi:type II secretory pathway pseudopilin PulG
MNQRTHNLQKGETLIEALGALAIIAIVIVAVATAVTASLSIAQFNEDQTLTTKYAQQGIEEVRRIRNANYTTFKTYTGLYCLGKGQTTLGAAQASCLTPNTDTYIRSVQIDQPPSPQSCAANVARVTVNVAFTDGKCPSGTYCHIQTQTSCLTTVNPVQAP